MKLRDLIINDMVQDDHMIRIEADFSGTKKKIAAGNWFQDHILDFMDREVETMTFYANCDLWVVTLKTDTSEAENKRETMGMNRQEWDAYCEAMAAGDQEAVRVILQAAEKREREEEGNELSETFRSLPDD